jgi:hypothetical protein
MNTRHHWSGETETVTESVPCLIRADFVAHASVGDVPTCGCPIAAGPVILWMTGPAVMVQGYYASVLV